MQRKNDRTTASLSPRNFLGGLVRSPASGWTTQRSSTSLDTTQKHTRTGSITCAHTVVGCKSKLFIGMVLWFPNSHFSSWVKKWVKHGTWETKISRVRGWSYLVNTTLSVLVASYMYPCCQGHARYCQILYYHKSKNSGLSKYMSTHFGLRLTMTAVLWGVSW